MGFKMAQQKKRKLTPKQAQFVCEYLKAGNASAAYRAAYDAKNMSNKSVGDEAYHLLQHPEIAPIVQNAKEEAIKKAEVTQEWIIEQLKRTVDMCLSVRPVEDEEGNVTDKSTFNPSASNKALELLGKELGMFTDKQNNVDRPNSEEFNRRLAELAFRLGEMRPSQINGAGKVIEGDIELPGICQVN